MTTMEVIDTLVQVAVFSFIFGFVWFFIKNRKDL